MGSLFVTTHIHDSMLDSKSNEEKEVGESGLVVGKVMGEDYG